MSSWPTIGIGDPDCMAHAKALREVIRQRMIRVNELTADFDWRALYTVEYYGKCRPAYRVRAELSWEYVG